MNVKPPHKKKKKKLLINIIGKSITNDPFKTVKVQLTIFTIAGNDIITVIVLYIDLLLWSKPIKYIW